MKKSLAFVLTASAIALAACETVGPPPPPPPPTAPRPSADVFRSSDFSWSAIPGQNRIDGRLTYRSGSTAYGCANVVLMPETPFTARRMSILYKSTTYAALPVDEVSSRTPPVPDGFNAFVRQALCDRSSRFSFTGLPDGAWFAITRATPASGSGPAIAVMRRVVTRGGRATALDL